jgi:hypothetical protein
MKSAVLVFPGINRERDMARALKLASGHEAALGGKGAHRIHYRRARGNRPAAQIIAIGKSAGHHHEIGALGQRCLGVPHHRRFMARDEPQRARHVALAIDAGKDENSGFHADR